MLCHCPGHRSCLSFCVLKFYNVSTASRSVGFRTYLAIVTGGFWLFARAWPLSRSAQLCFITLPPGRACEANDHRSVRPKISQISRYIGQISWRFEIDRPKALKQATVHSVFFKTLFDFKKSISGLIELKFSGKTPNEVLYAPIYFWGVYF